MPTCCSTPRRASRWAWGWRRGLPSLSSSSRAGTRRKSWMRSRIVPFIGAVDLHSLAVEALGQGQEDALHQAAVVRRQVDGVEGMVAVAGIAEDRGRPPPRAEVIPHAENHFVRRGLLGIRRADLAVAYRVGVNEHPAAADDVPVCGQLAFVGPIDAVGAPGQEIRVDRVGDEVDPGSGLRNPQGGTGHVRQVVGIEKTRFGMWPALATGLHTDGYQFGNLPRGDEEGRQSDSNATCSSTVRCIDCPPLHPAAEVSIMLIVWLYTRCSRAPRSPAGVLSLSDSQFLQFSASALRRARGPARRGGPAPPSRCPRPGIRRGGKRPARTSTCRRRQPPGSGPRFGRPRRVPCPGPP